MKLSSSERKSIQKRLDKGSSRLPKNYDPFLAYSDFKSEIQDSIIPEFMRELTSSVEEGHSVLFLDRDARPIYSSFIDLKGNKNGAFLLGVNRRLADPWFQFRFNRNFTKERIRRIREGETWEQSTERRHRAGKKFKFNKIARNIYEFMSSRGMLDSNHIHIVDTGYAGSVPSYLKMVIHHMHPEKIVHIHVVNHYEMLNSESLEGERVKPLDHTVELLEHFPKNVKSQRKLGVYTPKSLGRESIKLWVKLNAFKSAVKEALK